MLHAVQCAMTIQFWYEVWWFEWVGVCVCALGADAVRLLSSHHQRFIMQINLQMTRARAHTHTVHTIPTTISNEFMVIKRQHEKQLTRTKWCAMCVCLLVQGINTEQGINALWNLHAIRSHHVQPIDMRSRCDSGATFMSWFNLSRSFFYIQAFERGLWIVDLEQLENVFRCISYFFCGAFCQMWPSWRATLTPHTWACCLLCCTLSCVTAESRGQQHNCIHHYIWALMVKVSMCDDRVLYVLCTAMSVRSENRWPAAYCLYTRHVCVLFWCCATLALSIVGWSLIFKYICYACRCTRRTKRCGPQRYMSTVCTQSVCFYFELLANVALVDISANSVRPVCQQAKQHYECMHMFGAEKPNVISGCCVFRRL